MAHAVVKKNMLKVKILQVRHVSCLSVIAMTKTVDNFEIMRELGDYARGGNMR